METVDNVVSVVTTGALGFFTPPPAIKLGGYFKQLSSKTQEHGTPIWKIIKPVSKDAGFYFETFLFDHLSFKFSETRNGWSDSNNCSL
ncbi:hypothetical protein BDW_04895 [Bdellovibrio bacteriovorus W]|nr:hypothetical protein BDW_04895 [Bdellovibrio bacteriovorus W]